MRREFKGQLQLWVGTVGVFQRIVDFAVGGDALAFEPFAIDQNVGDREVHQPAVNEKRGSGENRPSGSLADERADFVLPDRVSHRFLAALVPPLIRI